jgi:undecaprenyl-diphosphatase
LNFHRVEPIDRVLALGCPPASDPREASKCRIIGSFATCVQEHIELGADLAPNLDVRILLELNSLVAGDSICARTIRMVGLNPFFRGAPVFFPLLALWFSRNSTGRRTRIMVGLLAASLATLISLGVQYYLPVHGRPYLDPAIHLYSYPVPDPAWGGRFDSFPSDTATLFFAFSTIVFLEHRLAGCMAFIWSFLTIGVARVALAIHYPSDVVGALILGVASVYLFSRIRSLAAIAQRILHKWEARMFIVDACFSFFIAEAYVLFPGIRGLGHILSFTIRLLARGH